MGTEKSEKEGEKSERKGTKRVKSGKQPHSEQKSRSDRAKEQKCVNQHKERRKERSSGDARSDARAARVGAPSGV